MKSHLTFVTVTAVFPCLLFAQSADPSPTAPVQARIVGDIPDGSPPKVVIQRPVLKQRPAKVRESKTVRQGGRNVTIQRIDPIPLPLPAKTASRPLSPDEQTALEKLLAQTKDTQPGRDILALGATVYHFADGTARTQATIWDHSTGKQHTFWSTADFGLLSGIGQFVSTDNRLHSLLLIWSQIDMENHAHLTASSDMGNLVPAIPEFDAKKSATFTFVEAPPEDPEVLCAIQSLHDIYHREHARLLAAWKGRERARLAREKELRDNPPKPEDITLRYWREEIPARKGGDQ